LLQTSPQSAATQLPIFSAYKSITWNVKDITIKSKQLPTLNHHITISPIPW
jgi:hypothetical protein